MPLVPRSPWLRRAPHFAPLVLVPSLFACASAPAATALATPAASLPTAAPHGGWSYTGSTGPEQWSRVEPGFAACANGTQQSPVALPRPGDASRGATLAVPHWEPVPLAIAHTGHAIQIDDPAPSSLVLDGVRYSLVQLHFHAPAEHTVDGHTFDAEMHLVHRAPDGQLAVVALLFRAGAENPVLRPVFAALPVEPGPARVVAGQSVDVAALLPRSPQFLTYGGSLTTPPCKEGVRWLVVAPDAAPLEIAAADLAKLHEAVHGDNRRPVQPTNGRAITVRAP